jgi:hypothetical protein
MYKQVDKDIFFDISQENRIFVEDIDINRFFNLCMKMDNSLPVTLPSFSGLSTDKFDTFVSKFNNVCILKNITEDKKQCALFHLCIHGPARSYLENLPEATKSSYELLLNDFKTKYDSPLNAAELQARSLEFHQLVWPRGSELETYAARIRDKGVVLRKNEGEMATQFISGLPEKLAFFVRTNTPETLEAALSTAKQGLAFGYGVETQASEGMTKSLHDLTAAVQSLQLAHINGLHRLTEVAYPQPQYLSAQPQDPSAQPQYPSAHPQYPSAQPQYPSTQSQYPSQPQYSSAQPQYPSALPQYPSAQLRYPSAQPQYPSTQSQHPPLSQVAPLPPYHCYATYGQPSQHPPHPDPRARPQPSNNCQRCGCPGHIATACNLVDNTRPRPDLTCQRCNQFGHGVNRCKNSGN